MSRSSVMVASTLVALVSVPEPVPLRTPTVQAPMDPVERVELSTAPTPSTPPADDPAKERVRAALGHLPLYFIQNKGQMDAPVRYYLQGADTSVYFTREGVTFALTGDEPRERWAVKLDFVGANREAKPLGEDLTPAVVSYFKGNKAEWKTGVPTYSKVVYAELWPGIDLVYSGTGSRLKYTLVVWPGADPKQIQLACRGATAVRVTEEGRLAVETPIGGFEDDTPYAYQEVGGERVEVVAAYTLWMDRRSGAHRYGFKLGAYDKRKPLILDPVVLTYTGYIGGSGTDTAIGIAVDGSGNAYVSGYTTSTTGFPVAGPLDPSHNGGTNDAFVAKVNASGTALVYCGYIGGSGNDFSYGVAVDSSDNAYVIGETASTESTFPVTVGPDLTFNGGTDAFVAKVNAAGTALSYCGYIGGSGAETSYGVAVDSFGNAYVTGQTGSTETSFPVTVGPDLTSNGGTDAFVAKVDASGLGPLTYCGYIGGLGTDAGFGIAVDGSGNAYVGGWTNSTAATFPVAVGPDLTSNGGNDVFVTKVAADGLSLVYSGFVGGSAGDVAEAIAVDAAGNVYLTGDTSSTEADFPVTVGPDLTFNGGTDAFVAKVDASGLGPLVYCGYIGGSGTDRGRGIAVDSSGNAYVSGLTGSSQASFPVTRGPDLTFNAGTQDAFVAKVNVSGSALSYCGYIGGSALDTGQNIAVDASGNAYLAGYTQSTETSFPAHVGPDSTYNGGLQDAFVAKIEDTGGTAVTLSFFKATGADGEVLLEWATASELDNLGFHLYRAFSAEGPYERLTASLIPGLGSSPSGAQYRFRHSGLINGTTYFYRLEDVETTGKTERHGPVSATATRGGNAVSSPTPASEVVYGQPGVVSLQVIERSARHLVLELRTGGFTAEPQADGSVLLKIPGLLNETGSFPLWRSWIEVKPGRKVEIASVREEHVESFSSLRPSGSDALEVVASRRGTVKLARGAVRSRASELPALGAARVVSVGYQGEVKKALVEIAPLRWDGTKLLLVHRLTVRLSFSRRDRAELSERDGRSHREPASHERRQGVIRLRVRERGVYGVGFEDLMSGRQRPVATCGLRLSRLGETVAFHVDPEDDVLGPGSTLYFWSEGASVNPYGEEAVYELEPGEGARMPVVESSSGGPAVDSYWHRELREENRYYQAGLLEAPDPWLWDVLLAPVRKSYEFELDELAASTEPSRLDVWLQGASELSSGRDHHVRLYVNGSAVGEVVFSGKIAERHAAELPSGLLREGLNELGLENVGDTQAAYSLVMLERFSLSYPRRVQGELEGVFTRAGVVDVSRLGLGAVVVDLTEEPVRWVQLSAEGRFRVEASHRYRALAPEAVLQPILERAWASRLKSRLNRADYLLVGPQSLLEAARPLLDLRRTQGLNSRAVPIEEVYSEFGFGESRPEAIRDFLAYAYHHWRRPSPRYVLLLGDGSYDFKNYLKTGAPNQVPPWVVKTSFLWTASDPAYGSVNGEDGLPDLAIGRLPAATAEEVRTLVEKILAYEDSGSLSQGPVVLVADNPDTAGNFTANAEELGAGLLASRHLKKIYLEQLGVSATRQAIIGAFDQGASLVSYVGHGGIHLWASEKLFDTAAVGELAAQPRQPIVLTLNCLNGYFHFPYFDSLSEELVKAEAKAAIAAFSPSGLSLNEPAHLYHHVLLRALLEEAHPRLGDAVLSAQAAYAASGAFPELLRIYHLFGDPALRLR